jgi:probable HAF family extracellular repeat protein
MTALGTLGGEWSGANDINEHGQIVGWSETASRDKHAVVWHNGKTTALGTLGGKWSTANDINEQREIVGWSETKAGDSHAFLWQNGRLRDLGTNGQKRSEASAINDRGQIIGVSYVKGDRYGNQVVDPHAFVWRNGSMTDLGKIAAPNSNSAGALNAGIALNERGQVVTLRASNTDRSQLLRWANGRATRIATVKRSSIYSLTEGAYSINERGQIAGSCASRVCLWQNTQVTDLGLLKGEEPSARVEAINERGEIVGSSTIRHQDSYAVLWRKRR